MESTLKEMVAVLGLILAVLTIFVNIPLVIPVICIGVAVLLAP